MVQVVFTSAGTTEQGMMAWADSSTAHLVCPEFQGTLSVMLICTVLELCLAWLAAVVWWKQARSDFTGVSVLATHPPPPAPRVLPGGSPVLGCVEHLQGWQRVGVVSHEIHMAGGWVGMEDR